MWNHKYNQTTIYGVDNFSSFYVSDETEASCIQNSRSGLTIAVFFKIPILNSTAYALISVVC